MVGCGRSAGAKHIRICVLLSDGDCVKIVAAYTCVYAEYEGDLRHAVEVFHVC